MSDEPDVQDSSESSDDDHDRGTTGRAWSQLVLSAFAGLVKGVAAVAGFAATYELAQALGKNDAGWRWEVLASVVAFGVGVVLVLAAGVMLSTSSREWMSDLVWRDRRHRMRQWEPPDRDLVDRETLLGHANPEEFQQGLLAILTHVRSRWERGQTPLPHEQHLLDAYRVQRDVMLEEQARRKMARSSGLSTFVAVLGVILAVGGYANAWYLTNLDVREAAAADAQAEHVRAMEVMVLEAALERPDAQPLVPQLQSDVVFTLPDSETATEVLGTDGVAATSCWQQRPGIALDWGDGGPESSPGRDLLVAYVATEDCAAGSAWIDPAWLGPGPTGDAASDPDTGATETASPTATPTEVPTASTTTTASPGDT